MTQDKTTQAGGASRLERSVRSGAFRLEATTPEEHELIRNAVDITMDRLIRCGAVDRRSSAEAWTSMIELAKRMLLEGKRSAASNGEVRGASRLAGEASSAEGATSTVVLGNGGQDGR